MDDLDRVFHRLVSNIRHRHPEYLTLPFTVQELYETLIPYRHHRRELGIETNQDYEIAVTRLLSGERDYLQADPEMRDKLEGELASPHFDTGAFREFAGAKVSLAPEGLRRARRWPDHPQREGSARRFRFPRPRLQRRQPKSGRRPLHSHRFSARQYPRVVRSAVELFPRGAQSSTARTAETISRFRAAPLAAASWRRGGSSASPAAEASRSCRGHLNPRC